MNEWPPYLFVWVVYAVIARGTSAPIVLLSWNRVRWTALDLLVLVVPFLVWRSLMDHNGGRGKSMANFAEPWLIAFAVPVAALIRVAVGKRFSSTVCSSMFVLLLSLVACCTFGLFRHARMT